MQGKMMMPFIHANERFRKTRKLVTTEMRPAVCLIISWLNHLLMGFVQAVTQYFNPIQSVEVHRLVKVCDVFHLWADLIRP
jgi:RNA-binding protein YlmH